MITEIWVYESKCDNKSKCSNRPYRKVALYQRFFFFVIKAGVFLSSRDKLPLKVFYVVMRYGSVWKRENFSFLFNDLPHSLSLQTLNMGVLNAPRITSIIVVSTNGPGALKIIKLPECTAHP